MILVHKDVQLALGWEWVIVTLVNLDTYFIIKVAILIVLLDLIKLVLHAHLVYLIVQFAMIVFLVKDAMIRHSTQE